MRILYVCTANVCRSVTAAALTRHALAVAGVEGVQVLSAGTDAEPGWPACSMIPAPPGLVGRHSSRPVEPGLLAGADLVLVAARDNQAKVVEVDHDVRQRLFTIRQAGRMSKWLLESGLIAAGTQRAEAPDSWPYDLPAGDPRRDVAPIPTEPAARVGWLVSELDAARGLAGIPTWNAAAHPDDLPDAHSGAGSQALHVTNYAQTWHDVSWLVAALREVMGGLRAQSAPGLPSA